MNAYCRHHRRTQARASTQGARPGSGPAVEALLACAAELERRAAMLRDQRDRCAGCVADVDLDDGAWMLRQAAGVGA